MFRGSLIFLFMFTLLLGACGTGLPSTLDDTLSIQGAAEDELRDTATLTINNLPDEVMLQVFSELSVKDILQAGQVCKRWQILSEEPALWRALRLSIHGDYPASEATKEQAIKHMLRVHVNTLTDLAAITHLVSKHKLNEEHPFNGLRTEMTDGYAAQGNETAISRKIDGFRYGIYGYEKNLKAADALNDSLARQGNKEAIAQKLYGLIYGGYGYEKNLEAAMVFNESLIGGQGNEDAIARKIYGLANGEYGYEKNYKAAVVLNESLIGQGNESAIERKIRVLANGEYGYEKNPKAAVALNESLIGQGNESAIERKIYGLLDGKYGYEKNPEAAVVFNNSLIEQGSEKAISRKIRELTNGGNCYTKDHHELKSWIEQEAANGKRWACYLKAQGLKYGNLGFKKHRDAAIQYILKNNIPY